jgi:hypothetical protein
VPAFTKLVSDSGPAPFIADADADADADAAEQIGYDLD